MYGWSAGRRYALSAGIIALATLMLARLSTDFQVTNIALLYLLVVLLIATTIGRGPAILASVLAFLGFNYFFVEPLHSFRVTNPQGAYYFFADYRGVRELDGLAPMAAAMALIERFGVASVLE